MNTKKTPPAHVLDTPLNPGSAAPVPASLGMPFTLLTLRDALAVTRLGRSAFYELVAAGVMPKPIKLSKKATRRSAARWIQSEIEEAVLRLANRR